MRKVLLVLALAVLFSSLASAEIIISTQPKETYNLGETITTPIVVKSLSTIYANIELNLICGGQEINFYKNGLSLTAGQEKRLDPSLILTKNVLGEVKGICLIKATIGEDYSLTNEFTITDAIDTTSKINSQEFNPGDTLTIEGQAIKKSKNPTNGFVEISIYSTNKNENTPLTFSTLETINNGFFFVNTTLSSTLAAGKYTIEMYAYEKDTLGQITNQGKTSQEFNINQIPTNLEIILSNSQVEPSTPLKGKIILHDQTGENIESDVDIKIFDPKDKLIEKFSSKTPQEFEFPTLYNTEPGKYNIIVESEELESINNFEINKKLDVKIEIVNNTLFLTNTGNVPYCNRTILIKIGAQALNLNPCIDVNKEQKYKLSAPNGEYEVSVISDEKEIKESVLLTGKTIEVSDAATALTLTRHPIIWFFVIAILGFVAFNIFKKGFKKTFIGYIHKRKTQKPTTSKTKEESIPSGKIFHTNPAELCLSIKGDKQTTTIIGLKLKNYKEIKRNLEGVNETISKISSLVMANKAAIYENEENVFIIFVPLNTKTFKNEKPALSLANNIKAILSHHNKLFKQKVEFGLSINQGQIIVTKNNDRLQFMSLGKLMTETKKISGYSDETILLSEKIRQNLGNDIKVEKFSRTDLDFYALKEVKEKGENEKFIKNFLERLEKK